MEAHNLDGDSSGSNLLQGSPFVMGITTLHEIYISKDIVDSLVCIDGHIPFIVPQFH